MLPLIANPTKPHVLHRIKDEEGLTYKLKNDPHCKDDIEDFCAKESRAGGNYDLLLCLQNQIKVFGGIRVTIVVEIIASFAVRRGITYSNISVLWNFLRCFIG